MIETRCEAGVRLALVQCIAQRGVGADCVRRAGLRFRPAAQECSLRWLPGAGEVQRFFFPPLSSVKTSES